MDNRTRKTSKFASEDVLSSMPDNVITNILDRLPLQDAVKTDVISKSWRYKWTMLSKLILDSKFFAYLSKAGRKQHRVRIISGIFLQLRGTITKCALSVGDTLDAEDVNYWVSFLSRKGIENLTFGKNTSSRLIKLPTPIFSCLGLKHLKLRCCSFHPPTTFHGFPNLLSLELLRVKFESRQVGEFITLCPKLKTLKMGVLYDFRSKVKSDVIAKLANLKTLSLFLFNLENMTITNSRAIFELLGFLPKIWIFDGARWYTTKERFPTAFPCLKALKLSEIDFGSVIMLSCVFEMIRHLPNLQTLEIIAASASNDDPTSAVCSPDVDYNTMGPSKLQSAVFKFFKGSEKEVCLIKYVLGCSPFLKKIGVSPHKSLAREEQLMFATKLLKLKGAYPEVNIGLY